MLNNPLTTKCGHTFCKGCLDRLHISAKASYPCPLCMTPITRRSLSQNPKISNLVSAVRNVISSIKLDCGVQGELLLISLKTVNIFYPMF